jgi:hypothetical protein
MPAIQPARLKKQVSDLAGKFNQPALFVRELHALLDLYTDHTHRSGQSGKPSPLIATYRAPPPVMRQVWHELIPLIKQQPADIIPLCDALWTEQNYDLQMLAARLLGQVAVTPANPVIDRLNSWVIIGLDDRIIDGLFEYGLVQLQQHAPSILLELVSIWMSSPDLPHKSGITGIITDNQPIGDGKYTLNLPDVNTILTGCSVSPAPGYPQGSKHSCSQISIRDRLPSSAKPISAR